MSNAKFDENWAKTLLGETNDSNRTPSPILVDPTTKRVLVDITSSYVVGPASSTDNAIARFDGATGKLIQDSGAILDDTGNLLNPGYLRAGSTSAPTNTTAGDLTVTRLKVGDGAFGSGVEASITGDGAISGFLRVGSETAPTNTTAGDITGVRLFVGSAQNQFTVASTGEITVAPTGNAVLMVSVSGTNTSNTGNTRGIKSSPTFTGSGAGQAAIEAAPIHQPSATVSAAYGFINIAKGQPDTGVTITTLYGGFNRVDTGSLAGTIGSTIGMSVAAPSFGSQKPTSSVGAEILNQGSASITTTIGLDIKAQTTSSTTIGLRLAAPTGSTSYALQLSDTGGTAAGGITFGTDVQLWRSAANTAKLLGNFAFDGEAARDITVARNTTTTGSNLTFQAGGAVSGSTNLFGGNLIFKSGISTGNTRTNIQLHVPVQGSSGTSDNSPTNQATLLMGTNNAPIFAIGNPSGSTTGSPGSNFFATNGDLSGGVGAYRHRTANTAGNTFTVLAGGSTSAATDKAGGTLILSSGISTGAGTSQIDFKAFPGIAAATTDNTAVTVMSMTSAALSPGTNDIAALGTTALQWSDLFLAEGGVINWDNGDATLTQTNNVVALAGAAFSLDSKISTYNNIATVSNGVPSELATIDSTGLTANVGASTLYAVPASGEGLYRVSTYVVETTAGSISSTLPNVQIVFTDKDSNTSITIDATPVLGVAGIGQTGALNANTVGTASAGVIVIYVKASTTIQYQTVNYASSLAGMTYALHIKLESL